MSSNNIMVTSSAEVANAFPATCPRNAFGDVTNKVTPNKPLSAPKSGLIEEGLVDIPVKAVCPPPVCLEDITISLEDVAWAENAMATELTDLELFGALVEGQHSKVHKTKKKKFTKASSSLPAHKGQGKKSKEAAVHNSDKKARQQRRKMAADAKAADIEDNLGEMCSGYGEPPVSPARKVAGRRVANVKKSKSFIPDELVDLFFDKCTPVVPALPSLDAIVCSDNAFNALSAVKEEEPIPAADSDGEDDELLTELEHFGARVEDQISKVPKTKKKFSKSSPSSLPARKRQEKKTKTAVYDSGKKARQQQRKKAAAAKYAYIEDNLGDICVDFEELPVAPSPVVFARAAHTRPQKAVCPDLVAFEDCIVAVPPLPSLPPITLSDNRFAVLEEEEEVVSPVVVELASPREGMLKRAAGFVKGLFTKAVKIVKTAFKAARNVVSC